MPADLDIDYKKNMRTTMPPYTRHVVIRTNQNDWASKIEDEGVGHGQEKKVNLARELKELIGPKGRYYDPRTSILISNCSFPSQGKMEGRDVLLYPEGYSINNVGETPESLEAFIEEVLMSSTGKPADVAQTVPHSVTKPTVLICGHNTRDRRCGVLGPLLQDEFLAQGRRYATTNGESEASSPPATKDLLQDPNWPFSVGLVSHVGGHAWAGNVIVYLPPDYRLVNGMMSPLAGKGVWYGRVQPKHVEGIVDETIRKGRVIEELLRGVHSGKDIG